MIVKEIRDIETQVLSGYVIDSVTKVEITLKDANYDVVMEHILSGGVVEPAYTELQRIQYMQRKTIIYFTEVTNKYIQDEVDLYNENNGTAFTNVDGFTKYAINANSVYYADALIFNTWNDLVWTTARQIQANVLGKVIMQPTEAEYLAMLPKRV